MALPAIVAIPIVGLIVWGVSSSAKSKKKRGRGGMQFVDDYTGLIIYDMDAAMVSRDAAIAAHREKYEGNVQLGDARTVLLRWMEMVSPRGEESRAWRLLGDPWNPGVSYSGSGFNVPESPTELQRAQAALLIRLWDSLLDEMWDRDLVPPRLGAAYGSAEDSYLYQGDTIWETMGHYDLTEEDVMELAEIEVTG